MPVTDLGKLRKDYQKNELRFEDSSDDPLEQFQIWFQEALQAEVLEPNAMSLSTVDPDGQPSSRIVLLKEVNEVGLHFFTNYHSPKSRHLQANPKAALNILWKELERQICIRGHVVKTSREESERYFHSRPYLSQIGAWVSAEQSAPIPSRECLLELEIQFSRQYPEGQPVPLPPHWGGYILIPDHLEFWQGRPSRLHDRLLYSKNSDTKLWEKHRLSP